VHRASDIRNCLHRSYLFDSLISWFLWSIERTVVFFSHLPSLSMLSPSLGSLTSSVIDVHCSLVVFEEGSVLIRSVSFLMNDIASGLEVLFVSPNFRLKEHRLAFLLRSGPLFCSVMCSLHHF
jgi:hypothetical protein